MLDRLRKFILYFLGLLAGASFLFVFLPTPTAEPSRVTYGVTYVPSHARYLGLDSRQTYLAILDDLRVPEVRLAAFWNEIEPQEGVWEFRELDWLLEEARKRGVRVMLAIGRKLPRWPECRVPQWAAALGAGDMEQAILAMLRETVLRYRSHPAVASWQVENEPLFSFGNCPAPSLRFYDQEVSLVRRLDPSRPIVATDSGELSGWVSLARRADLLGVSLYQMTWNPIIGYFSYPLPPSYYARKAWIVKTVTGRPTILSELQTEPWLPDKSIHELSYDELEKSFTLERFRKNIAFARKAGFSLQYLWGVEWWAWAAANGHPEFWEEARRVLH